MDWLVGGRKGREGGRRRGGGGEGEGTLANSWRRSRGGRTFVGRSLTIVDIVVVMVFVVVS